MCKRTASLFLTFVILISFFSIATAQEPEPVPIIAPPTEPADPEVIMATIQNLHDAFNVHDMELWKTYVTDDVVVDAVPSPPPASGKEEAAAFFEAFIQGFPDLYGNLDSVLISGNIAVAQTTMTGTHLGEWAGIAPTGSKIQVTVLEVMEFEGDKEKRVTFYWDAVSMMVQLGVMPASELDPALLVPSFTLPDPEPTGLAPLEAYAELTARWNSADLSHWSKMIHQDADILVSSLGIPMNRDAYIAFQELYLLGFPDREQENIHVVDLGDGWVLTEMVFTGTNDGPYLGIPATGLPITLRAGQVNRFDEDGILTYQYSYFDSLTILAQIGALEPEAPTEEELIALHQTHMAALGAHDVDQIMSFFTDDAIYDYVLLPAPMTTKEEIGAFFGNLFQAFPDYETTSEHLLVAGNIMVTEHTTTGTHQGEWSGIPATGNTVLGMHMDIFEFEGEKLKQATTYDNAASMLIQLGLMPASELPELVPSFQLPASEAPGLSPLEAAENAMAVWNTHDLVSYAKLFHPDAEILIAPFGVPMDLSAFIASQELYFLAYSDLQEETVRIVDMGDGWVLAEIVFVGTNDGPYFGVPATGNSMEVRGAWIGHYDEDGLATKMNVYWDHLTTLTQLGLFPPPSETEANKELVRRYIEEIWAQQNLELVGDFVSPDVVGYLPEGEFTGIDGVVQHITGSLAAFPDFDITLEEMIAEGDRVAARFTARGTHEGALLGLIPATGKQIVSTGIFISQIADGKMVGDWSIADMLGVMQQIGVIPSDREDYTWGEPMDVAAAPGDPEANKAIARRVYEEIWNQGNLELADELYAADYVRHDPVSPGIQGSEGFKQLVAAYRAAFSDLQFTVEDQVAEGDRVVNRFTVTGVHTGEFNGIPPTGVEGSLKGISIHRIADGRIAETWITSDQLGMMQQLGVIPPIGPPVEPVEVVETGSASLESWLAIIRQNEFTPEERDDGLYLVATTLAEFEGDAVYTFDVTGNQLLLKARLQGEFQELKVEFDDTGNPISATGPARGSVKMLDADGNVVFHGSYMLNQTLQLAADFTPTGANPVGYSTATGVGKYANCHSWMAVEGGLAPNPENPEEIGYALTGRGEFTKQVITAKPPTGHHTSEGWYRRVQDPGIVPEQRADGLYLVSTMPTISSIEYIYTFDTGEETTTKGMAWGERQELKVSFDENGVPVRAVGGVYGLTMKGSDSYGNTTESVVHLEYNISLSPDMKPTSVAGEGTVYTQSRGKFANYINTDRVIITLEPDPENPTEMVYHAVGNGEMTEVTGFSSVGMHSMNLQAGLNMLSLPLKPIEPYDARSLAEELGATVVIRYDGDNGRFAGFTMDSPGNGFPIEAGEGYIVNLLNSKEVEFMGTIWGNIPLHEFDAAPPVRRSAWALAVSGSVLDGEGMSAEDGSYMLTAKNLRTGATAIERVDTSGYFAAVWADLSRKAVAEAGDKVEVAVIDSRGKVVSGPFVHDITLDGIRNAVVKVQLRLGDIIPEKSALLQNYPNPFNPETWIPFHLKGEASVSIRIFNLSGQLIKTLDLGHTDAGVYVSRTKAAYWDGKNEAGEEVSSGIYFYSITAGDFSATKKMIIRK